MQITARADFPAPLSDRYVKQLPFALMRALNDTAFEARTDVQQELPKRFRLKNTWTHRQILVEKASKASLVAYVTAPDYMRKQEEGGNVSPTAGRRMATPKHLQGKIIRSGQRPSAVMEQDGVFILKRGGGQSIAKRIGKRRLRILYWLTGDQSFDKRFDMAQTVDRTVYRRFGYHFDRALQHAINTAR